MLRPGSATFEPLTAGGVGAWPGGPSRKLVVARGSANAIDERARSMAQNLRRVAAEAPTDVVLIEWKVYRTGLPEGPIN